MRGARLGRKTRAVFKRRTQVKNGSPVRLLLWTGIAVILLTWLGAIQPFEDVLRVVRNRTHVHAASGDIVLVPIDDHALREVGRWPWPRRYHARLIDELTAAGAKQIFSDITFETGSNAFDDQLLAEAIERSGRVTLPVRGQSGPDRIRQDTPGPLEMFSRKARFGSIFISYNFQNAVWSVPYGATYQGSVIPSFASGLSGSPIRNGEFTPDYSIDPKTIPKVNAANAVSGQFDRRQIAGKTVIIGTNSEVIGDQYYIPGVGKMGGVFVQIIAAETLKAGTPVNVTFIPPFLLALALAAYAAFRTRAVYRNTLFAGTTVALLFIPAFLEARLIFVDVAPALLVVATVWSVLSWRGLRKRGLVNPISSLPNLSALRSNRNGRNQALIAARIFNYEEIAAALPARGERQLIDQVVSRLKLGASDRTLFHGDGGVFAWFEESKAPFGNHLDALHAMFRNPARVDGLLVDLSIAFGVEVGSSRSLANRLASALVAAEEAAHDGLKWKYHDPDSLQDASWKLSMLSQLDDAIDGGQVWVAYQPKLELSSRRIIGAEALARWTHPEKGPIAATEFVAAAEQHNRIGKLTDFVLEKAVGGAAQINQRGIDFGIAVNLSARLLTDKGFTLRLSALLARHGLAPDKLTLELTETAALGGSGEGIDMISRLRDLGVRISIDDYGTGLSTLDYLKKIPANEIKIDQSFVKGMADNRSDRVMVQSTIGLAHSLDRKVVAEGVEHSDILDLLIGMKCDIAQGFAIGRPMSLESLTKRIASDRKRSAA
jgi:EAL domain-containing protein (putative c-di-GMP-specific phosphodiesterase class I)/CHASE2 domain-containing sensor protein